MSERRAFPRWAVALECEASGKAGNQPVVINNLSENGLGLVCGSSAEVGEQFDLWWRLGANGEPVETHCVVRAADESKVGVEFVKLSRANRLRLLHFICDKQLVRADARMISHKPRGPLL